MKEHKYEGFDLEKIKNEVESHMEKYPEHVTLEDIRQWLSIHRNEISGMNTYGVKHLIERDYGIERGHKFCYCANNWVKYVIVEMGVPLKQYVVHKGQRYYLPQPTPDNILENTVNYFVK